MYGTSNTVSGLCFHKSLNKPIYTFWLSIAHLLYRNSLLYRKLQQGNSTISDHWIERPTSQMRALYQSAYEMNWKRFVTLEVRDGVSQDAGKAAEVGWMEPCHPSAGLAGFMSPRLPELVMCWQGWELGTVTYRDTLALSGSCKDRGHLPVTSA